ncbi:hypothetical protein CALCODRAFT_92465 [Calocera cornea HHB12733]|uniref:Nucleolar pre-ribosomal-associated protein 1 C-terminal domain-containing protein n=1 Tax=Calocera cornea HHB12733 TaxID=1353952 RepID=A0A165D9T4_9BASI|nr:hypothetical protein CALCODRAFT_92465 [Calocera cornea HHB12733]
MYEGVAGAGVNRGAAGTRCAGMELGRKRTKLLSMRRKGKINPADDPLYRPDIRTLYILFLLSFLSTSTPASLKTSFLGQKDTFTAIFKDLRRDHTNIVRKVLEVSWEGIWEDKRVRRTAKIGVFNEWMLGQILRLYERDDKDDPSHAFSAADLAHHFLLAICTRPGVGICFADGGWYPRETETGEGNEGAADEPRDEPDQRHQQKGRIYNKILSNFLKALKVGEDARQQELALKILEACPELVTGYWPSASISLEPRLSSRWLINAAFLGRVVSLPIPVRSFRIASSSPQSSSSVQPYRPDPPPLSALIANTFPSLLNRAHLTKGLQAKQGMVQLFTAQTLARCFEKFERVRTQMRAIEDELGERTNDGQWRSRRLELQSEARRRVPDFSVIIAFSQQKIEGEGGSLTKKRTMLREVAVRLLWCYQSSLPDLMVESRFDAGRLFSPGKEASPSDDEVGENEEMNELDSLGQLHVLRLLRGSEQFNWSAKPSGSPHTFLYHFLLMRAKSRHAAIKSASEDLVQHLLGTSLLFEHDPNELPIWLESLPVFEGDGTTLGPDGNPLTDQATGVIALLDDCVNRCLKTPYRYVEELGALLTTPADASVPLSARAHSLPSPLLMTMLEQLRMKHKAGIFSFSAILATLAFLRRLILGLAGKEQNFITPHVLTRRVNEIVQAFRDDALEKTSEVARAEQGHLLYEVTLLSDSLDVLSNPSSQTITTPFATAPFVDEAAQSSDVTDAVLNRRLARRIVDQFRLITSPLSAADLKHLIAIVSDRSSDGTELRELLLLLNPKLENIWAILSVHEASTVFERVPYSFWIAFIHADRGLLGTSLDGVKTLAKLAEPLLQSQYQALLVLRCLLGRLSSLGLRKQESLADVVGCLSLLNELLQLPMPQSTKERIKMMLFAESPIMQEILSDIEGYTDVLCSIVRACLDSGSDADRNMAGPFCGIRLEENLERSTDNRLWLSCWIPYLSLEHLEHVVNYLVTDLNSSTLKDPDIQALEDTLTAMKSHPEADLQVVMKKLPLILQHHEVMMNENVMLALEGLCKVALPIQHEVSAFFTNVSLVALLTASVQRFQQVIRCNQALLEAPVSSVFSDSHIVSVLSPLLYRLPSIRHHIGRWLMMHGSSTTLQTAEPLIHRLLEAETLLPLEKQSPEIATAVKPFMKDIAKRLFMSSGDEESMRSCEQCLRCYSVLVGVDDLASWIAQIIPPSAPLPFNRFSLRFMEWAIAAHASNFKTCLNLFVDGVLRWLVRRFSEDQNDTDELLRGLRPFCKLMERVAALKRHLVDPVLTAVIRSRFAVAEALELGAALCTQVGLPTDAVNRHLQSILQHSQLKQASPVVSPRLHEAAVQLIHTLCSAHPQTTFQPVQLRRIVALYGGSLSVADRTILNLLGLFEKQRSSTAMAVLAAASKGSTSSRPGDLITALDAARMLKTCLAYPQWREFNSDKEKRKGWDRPDLYDPVYVLGLLGMVLSQEPLSGLDWVNICRTDVISLAICALASKHAKMRKVAVTLITATWMAIQEIDFFERDQLSYTLQLVRNALAWETEPERLPTFTVLLCAYAVHSLFHPAVLVYPHISRFLLQRPALDTTDVPLLYGMLYSSSDDWRRERLWIIRFIGNAMRSTADWHAIRRRRAWDLLATLFQSNKDDRQIRQAIFEVLGSLTQNQYATHALVLRSSLLAWLNVQLLTIKPHETLFWLRVLENIVMVVDHEKLEHDTYKTWRSDVSACISKVLGATGSESWALHTLHLGARIMLRISNGAEPPWTMPNLLDLCVTTLQNIEKSLGDAPPPCPYPPQEDADYHRVITQPPAALSAEEASSLWAQCVRKLWRVGMTLDPSPSDRASLGWWKELTPRLIAIGEAGAEEGEWARREVLRNIVLKSVE